MADRIELRGLECFGYHGVFEEEKRTGQTFLVDLICWLDCAEAARTDDLNLTINYADLAHMAHTIVSGPSCDLIETVAANIADSAMAEYPQLHAVEVTLHKPQAPIPLSFADVAVGGGAMRAVLSIGSNMNDRRALLQGAYDHFRPELVAASHIYATPPWGVTDQEDFLNAILIVETSLSPMELLRAGQALERAAHRVHTRKWGARTLDVDLICCADGAGHSIESSDPTLTLPHPWAAERVFVLVPWLDADSQATLNGVHVTELLAALDPADVEAVRVVGSFAERGLE